MENYVLEIKDAEGGEDSKLLVDEMFNIYTKAMVKNNFNYKVIKHNKGLVVI
jgi:protein subunit release factor A